MGVPRDGFLVMGKSGNPESSDVSLSYGMVKEDGTCHLWVIGQYFGILLATDSRLPAPTEAIPPTAASVLLFTASDCRAA